MFSLKQNGQEQKIVQHAGTLLALPLGVIAVAECPEVCSPDIEKLLVSSILSIYSCRHMGYAVLCTGK